MIYYFFLVFFFLLTSCNSAFFPSLIAEHGDEMTDISAKMELGFFHNVDAIIRYKEIMLNPDFLDLKSIKEGDLVILDLFGDSLYLAIIDRTNIDINEVISIRARIKDHEGSYLILSIDEGRAAGTIDIPSNQEYYRIFPKPGSNAHYLAELDKGLLDILPH